MTLTAVVMAATAGQAQVPQAPSDSVTIRIVATELRSAVQIMQQYLDRPVIFAGATAGPQVTLETPHPVPRADVVRYLRGLLDAQGYELVSDTASGTYRARLKEMSPASRSAAPATTGFAPAARPQATMELFVIALKHARAADVASNVNTLFGRGTFGQIQNTSQSRTLADELRANQMPPLDAGTLSPSSSPASGGRPATLTGDITIVPDPHANSLLIRANRADFDLIKSIVDQIDVRPPQALIEVLIVEAQRDRSFSLGLQAAADDVSLSHRGGAALGSGALSPGSGGLGDFTLKVMGLGGLNLDATIGVAAGRGDVRIISRPVVLTANDEQAEVVVGSQRPFVQVSRTLPASDVGIRDEVVQYKDVGTRLRVRPTISIDGTVQLDVSQEVSNATTETQFNAPVISTRSVRTDLIVHDGQTIVLGGLTDREHDVQSEGVPFFSSIPLIGGFFGRHSRSTTETELFIFLTPRVIRSDDDAERLTSPLRDRAEKIKP
ncbi:MAG TPA: secretin N-terminal domain-containing protein [Gemmatimonadaceae bacterium]|jgi:general secretion pathway protein D|nr:secretin N-terminal domain-containing protein [Gemmatimonadaceae bacterium]